MISAAPTRSLRCQCSLLVWVSAWDKVTAPCMWTELATTPLILVRNHCILRNAAGNIEQLGTDNSQVAQVNQSPPKINKAY
ncbi:hypothetical protein F4680DRAFT_440056 [Xylaria scruposa]|nr:hypothetical protein F4680DRAFT_440056 [Xylaria scruposa]